MWRFGKVALLVLGWSLVLTPSPSAAQQQEDTETTRKVVNRVVPVYPDLARAMGLKGIVKVEAVVTANGTVKSVETKGGHPVLVQAAQNAVRKWKWVPAAHETREPIEIRFNPQ